jgi:hypothetical protein
MTARRVWIVIAVVVGGLVVLNLIAAGLDRAVGGNQPGGTPGSSYATAPQGLAAFRTLLTRFGHDVRVQRGTVADRLLDPNTTIFVIETNSSSVAASAATRPSISATCAKTRRAGSSTAIRAGPRSIRPSPTRTRSRAPVKDRGHPPAAAPSSSGRRTARC